jgi:hypothetical protein
MNCADALDYLIDAMQPAVTHLRREGFDVVMPDGSELVLTVVRLKGFAAPPAYTGELCPKCGSAKMRRAGACSVCEECGESSGCG